MRWAALVVIGVSLSLRLVLTAQGGQYFFGDEERYDRGVQLYFSLRSGDLVKARELAALPEHMLFTWCGALLTAGQHVLAQLTPYGDWNRHPVNATFTMWIGALLLSLFSTLNLALTYRLARALGASDEESLWTLLLMATASTAFYYARHLLPYECALSFALLALIVGLGASTRSRAFACGFLVGIAYGLYNGYWYLVPVVWLTHAVAARGERRAPQFAMVCAGGVALALAVPSVFGTMVDATHYWTTVRNFSNSVRQGSMAEGWSLPWEYFWHAEGLAGILVVAAIVAALIVRWRGGQPLERRVRLMILALGASYALLVLGSNVLRSFTVYGRTVKPFIPLMCVLGGWGIAQLAARRPWIKLAAATGLVMVGTLHFRPHFSLLFPRQIEVSVLRNWGNPKRTLSIAGSIYIPLALPVARPDLALVNAQMLYPVSALIGYPEGTTLFRAEHPLSWLPYQYEGHAPHERALLRNEDISVRLIKLARPADLPNDLPLALRAQSAERRNED